MVALWLLGRCPLGCRLVTGFGHDSSRFDIFSVVLFTSGEVDTHQEQYQWIPLKKWIGVECIRTSSTNTSISNSSLAAISSWTGTMVLEFGGSNKKTTPLSYVPAP
ncbi:uncharacterized protein TRIVIDRAFT_62771 [Trichoderma virens Gv29-8]|uniref:Uncharacterized protein n=1 Tax=Hypocrea virens (strain Gv29-8 / FGSC 10586) TaxID=413071 RepID=G9MF12_HYPVG|nr:uncharacterized protein TRIVIDRAFT_62771 [Trichoderma virens Gv29-8]EHK26978.1 hypothetical protein TRIVIDRAFT_62771 [Trichoderma virens Gv29-8]UKZ57431.1 hypothetical protein TrVGV298_011288 [Trichoderma virens]